MKCCLTSTETVGLLGTGAQDGHLDFHTAPDLWNTRTVQLMDLWPVQLLEKVKRRAARHVATTPTEAGRGCYFPGRLENLTQWTSLS